MKEISDIIAAYDTAVAKGTKTALATVVHVEGSSYRRPGARMLVTEEGILTGAISGGCLEGDALRKALLAIHQNQNKIVTYDTTDDDPTFGVQLGCNGIVHILFEPLQPGTLNAISLLKQVNSSRELSFIATAFSFDATDNQPGSILALSSAGQTFVQTADLSGEFKEAVLDAVHQMALSKSSASGFLNVKGTAGKPMQLFIQAVQPPIALLVCGAGNDSQPLVQIGEMAGWQVTVVDGRKTHAVAGRFPGAQKVVVAKADDILNTVDPDSLTAAVSMTHNYNYDIKALEHLLKTECPYIGILGPLKKLQKMFDELEEQGRGVSELQKGRIFSPVGLDIGAETAEEIALSIAAEIKGVLSGSSLRQLREKRDSIHVRPDNVARTFLS